MRLKLNLQLQQVVKNRTTYLNPLSAALGIFYFKRLCLVLLLFCSSIVFSQTRLKVTNSKYNFGSVKKGDIVKCEFEIINTGNEPLLLKEAEVGCSCTTVEFSKQPVLPGQKTIIVVIFNTKTVYGRQDRVVILYSNANESPSKLRYKGMVSTK